MTRVVSYKHGGGAPCELMGDVGSRFRMVKGADSGRFFPDNQPGNILGMGWTGIDMAGVFFGESLYAKS